MCHITGWGVFRYKDHVFWFGGYTLQYSVLASSKLRGLYVGLEIGSGLETCKVNPPIAVSPWPHVKTSKQNHIFLVLGGQSEAIYEDQLSYH